MRGAVRTPRQLILKLLTGVRAADKWSIASLLILSRFRGGNPQVEKLSFGALRFSFAGFVDALSLIHCQLPRTLTNLFQLGGSGPLFQPIASFFLQIFHYQI